MRLGLGLLLSAAVLLGCQENQNLQGRIDSLRTANQDLERQVQTLRDSLRADQDKTTLTPPIHFPSGSAWIPDQGRRQLDEYAETLEQRYPNRDVHVKGYTDNVPIGPTLKDIYPSNWYLSAQRAAAVVHYLENNHELRTSRLEIRAFGSQSPVGSNETPEGRRKNRRVEIGVEGGS